LGSQHHKNGIPLFKIHGPAELDDRGGTIAFNFLDENGESFDVRLIEILAHEASISLRTGCFCNPGAGEVAFGVNKGEIEEYFKGEWGMDFDEFRMKFAEQHARDIGAVRISVGLVTNFADVFRFLEFAQSFLNKSASDFSSIDTDLVASRISRDSA
jgi:selenocysteine lyase/cysteine desulfurase